MEKIREKVNEIVNRVNINEDNKYYSISYINKNENKPKISIVMTSSDRSEQVYFTLETISNSKIKDIEIILVDDSLDDKIGENILEKFNLPIILIVINRENKIWSNPCVNYNIGFKYISGSYVIIQNGEVCHIGDICDYIINNCDNDSYYCLDVLKSDSFDTNKLIINEYRQGISVEDLLIKTYYNVYPKWYQHYKENNRYFHFLTFCSRETFNKIDGFSYDYAIANSYDDNDLVLKIKSLGIPLRNIMSDKEKIYGIHLFHNVSNGKNFPHIFSIEISEIIFRIKEQYMRNNNRYIEFSS